MIFPIYGLSKEFQRVRQQIASTMTAALDLKETKFQFNVKDYGAVGDGVTDDGVAITAAVTAANAAVGVLYFPPGTYYSTVGFVVTCNVDNDNAILLFPGTFTGTGLHIGAVSGATLYKARKLNLPGVTRNGQSSTVLPTTGIGIRITNIYYSEIAFLDGVNGWGQGVWIGGIQHGFAYNKVTLSYFYDNGIALRVEPETVTGWANDNVFFGGELRTSSNFGDRKGGAYTSSFASPCVITCTGHKLDINDTFTVTVTTGGTGIAIATTYYVIAAGFTANSFQFSLSLGGAAVNTTATDSGQVYKDDGTRLFVLKESNQNTFIGLSFEGGGAPSYYWEFNGALSNQIQGGRIEKSLPYIKTVLVLSDAAPTRTVARNQVLMLYCTMASGQSYPTFITGTSGGSISPPGFTLNTGTAFNDISNDGRGIVTVQNQYSAGVNSLAVFAPSVDSCGSPANWSLGLSASYLSAKATTDVYSRIRINNALGQILFGSGSGAEPVYGFYLYSGSILRSNGSLICDLGNRIGLNGIGMTLLRHGTATLVAGTVTVADTNVSAASRIFVSLKTPGGTQGFLSTTRVASTSFTIVSTSALETSVVEWMFINP